MEKAHFTPGWNVQNEVDIRAHPFNIHLTYKGKEVFNIDRSRELLPSIVG